MTTKSGNAMAQARGKAKGGFNKAVGSAYAKVSGDQGAVKVLRNIDARAANIKKSMRKHFVKNRDSWVAREAIKTWQQRTNPVPHLRPKWGRNSLDEKAIMRQARINVHQRMTARLSEVNRIKTRQQNAVSRSHKRSLNDRDVQLSRDFKKANKLSQKKARNMSW